MSNAVRIAFVVAFVNSFLMLFFISGYYPRANVYVSAAALTFAICVFGIPILAAISRIRTRGHFIFLALIALLIFGPAILVINANFEKLNPEQLILPIVGGVIIFLFTFIRPKKG